MSGLSQEQRDAVRQAQQEWLAQREVSKCPTHAQSTGTMRYVNARKVQREAEHPGSEQSPGGGYAD